MMRPSAERNGQVLFARPRRAQWRTAGPIMTAVLVVATLVAVPLWASGGPQSPARTGPATSVPAAQMPQHLGERAKAVLGKHAAVGAPRTVALNKQFEEIPIDRAEQADSLFVTFGDTSSRSWKVYLGKSDGKPSGVCPRDSWFAECDAATTVDGTVVITSTRVGIAAPEYGEGMYTQADVKSLTEKDLPDLRVDRNVRAFKPDGTMTSATEQVIAPKSLDFATIFVSPVSDLAALANDRSLVAP